MISTENKIDLEVEDELDEVEVSDEDLAKADKSNFSHTEVVRDIQDDFIVPANFQEFIDRYPKYFKTWLFRNHCPQFLIEDFEQEMNLYMLKVSANGRKKGINDRIMSFSGDKIGGKSAGKFFFYVNLLLMRKWKVLIDRRLREPVDQKTTLNIGLSQDTSETGFIPGMITEENLIKNAERVDSIVIDSEEDLTIKYYVRGFIKFVNENEPELVPFIDELSKSASLPDVCRNTKLTIEEVNKNRNRLRILAKVYDSGMSKIPNKRKSYNKRKKD